MKSIVVYPVVFFDGYCHLCDSSVQFVLAHEKEQKLRFASLQSKFAAKNLDDNKNFSTIVFMENNKVYYKSQAVIKIARYLKFPYNSISLLAIFPYSFLDVFYAWIAKNRYKWFGRKNTCEIPSETVSIRFFD